MEAARGPWRLLEALGGFLKVLGGSKRPLEVLWRTLEAARGLWRLLEDLEVCMRPLEVLWRSSEAARGPWRLPEAL